ncbi:hypothetical protein TRICI_006152 [Trichomonascus ciferrii]|uniref:DNA 3'-5' helicase n=1 Tax=Trichomonascus ciferrii TaxID=44093 RepID=A0A642UMF9_9ASCO|nr:hypothetical protein TRICI_006152 [Trichomonascus ciferrii]
MPTDNEKVQQMLDGLNAAQKKAVTMPVDSRVQILAGPGTGKTKTLTSRVAYLLHLGVNPENLVVMTFTNKAANEMKERVGRLTDSKPEMIKRLRIGTFHSVGIRYLFQYGKHIGIKDRISIVDESDREYIIKEIMQGADIIKEVWELGYSTPGKGAKYVKDGSVITPKYMMNYISSLKNKGITAAHFCETNPKSPFSLVYRKYQARIEHFSQVDFDDVLLKTLDLLKSYPQAVDHIEAVMVDEFQDSNGIQLEMTKLFAQANNNITVVGDPDQSIYSFRNAQPKNLQLFCDSFPDTKLVYLEENYRSCQTLLDHATALIKSSVDRYGGDRKLIGYKGRFSRPILARFGDEEKEKYAIGEQIAHLMRDSKGAFEYKDFAILSRTRMWMTRMESVLNRRGIPYIISNSFWERREIKTIVDYLRVIYSGNDRPAIMRTLNIPSRGFGEVFMQQKMAQFSENHNLFFQLREVANRPQGKLAQKTGIPESQARSLKHYIQLIEECRKILGKEQTLESLVEVIGHINNELLLHQFFGKNKDAEDRLENINELKMLIFEHDDDSDEVVDEMTEDLTPFGKFLATATLTGKVRDKDSNAVTLTTIHSSKGLEWPVVFIPNCVQSSLNNCKDDEEIEEVRRVFFVAGTRAKALLYMSHPDEIERYSGTEGQQPLDMLTSPMVAKCTTTVNSKFPKLSQAQFTEYAKFLGRMAPLTDKTPSFSSAFNLMQIEKNAKVSGKRKNAFQSPLIAKKAASDEHTPPSK